MISKNAKIKNIGFHVFNYYFKLLVPWQFPHLILQSWDSAENDSSNFGQFEPTHFILSILKLKKPILEMEQAIDLTGF